MAHFVIVGAGSAGCVLAARLTEDSSIEVILIEAGGTDTDPEIHIPAAQSALRKTHWDWDYTSQREPGLDGRFVYLPRGKVLGGSSSINAMAYIRGNRADYDGWAADGAKGWSYEDVLPYFRKSETNEWGESQFHGKFGPLSVCDGRSRHPLTEAFVRAAVEAGHELNSDFNGASQDGFGRYQCTQRNGMRCSTAVAYLRPAMSRANLKIFINAHATRILFDRNRACGVEFARDGRLEQAQADTEVILAAGTYNSPQLLMLSGIGPAPELTRLGISVRGDLPVGVGLQDHPMAWLSWHTETESLITAATPENHALLQNEGRGPLSSNGAEAGGFVRTRAGLPAPDIQFHAVPAIVYDDYQDMMPAMEHGMSLSPCVLKPLSRGKVALRNASPFSKPAIVHNYYAEPEDRRSMIDGVRVGLEIAAQPAMRTHITQPYRVPKSESEADIWEYVQRYTQTIFHPTSTCAIGPVVDNELRVQGFEGLRVVDASVMPSIVRGNTNAPTVMIAERAADLIHDAQGRCGS